jgi:hypothetical protein
MNSELLVVSGTLIVLIIFWFSIKEHKQTKTGKVKFVQHYDTTLKHNSHSPTNYLSYFVFDVDGKEYKKAIETYKCNHDLVEKMTSFNKEMEYLEVYRTNIFRKQPYFYKIEIPEIEKMI